MNLGFLSKSFKQTGWLLVAVLSLAGCQTGGVTGTAVTGGVSAPPNAAPQATKLPDWTSDPKLTAQLTQSVESTEQPPRFTIKVPKDFRYMKADKPRRKFLLFRGPEHKDGTMLAFTISTIPTALGMKTPVTVEQGFKLTLDAVRRGGRQEQWKATPTQRGSINGQEFLRSYWSGMEAVRHKLAHGVVYVTVVDGDFIILQGQDFEGFSAATLPLVEAATMTFKLAK